jgi:hypothetical protein
MSSNRAGPVAVTDRGEVDDHRDVLVATAGVPQGVLVNPDHLNAVEPAGILDQHPLAFSQDRVVGGVPCDAEAFGDPGHGQVLAHDSFQRPPQTPARQLRPRRGGVAGVLAPHVPTPGAPVAAHRHFQRGRPPPERLVRQPTDHGVTRQALAAATATPLVRFDRTAGQHRPIRLQPLPDHFQAEFVQASEPGQVGTSEGSVGHSPAVETKKGTVEPVASPAKGGKQAMSACLSRGEQ